jgi:predicted nucleic acid-binding Zn ribbon protein
VADGRRDPPHGPPAWHWREPAPIRNVLLEGARKWGLDSPLEIARVFGSWREMVGEQVAARCEPASLGQGVLKVWAASAPWANELKYLAPEVIRRVNAAVGQEVVRELKVALRPGPGSGDRSGRRRVGRGMGRRPGGQGTAFRESDEAFGQPSTPPAAPATAPPSPDVEAAEAMVAAIGDERLAEATKRAVLAAKTQSRHSRENR